jgi:hypothetical protein
VGDAEVDGVDADAVDEGTVDDAAESLDATLASDSEPSAEAPTVSAIP